MLLILTFIFKMYTLYQIYWTESLWRGTQVDYVHEHLGDEMEEGNRVCGNIVL